jgi:hypothetical protein
MTMVYLLSKQSGAEHFQREVWEPTQCRLLRKTSIYEIQNSVRVPGRPQAARRDHRHRIPESDVGR